MKQRLGVLHIEVDDDFELARCAMHEAVGSWRGWLEGAPFPVVLASHAFESVEYTDVDKVGAIWWRREPILAEMQCCPLLHLLADVLEIRICEVAVGQGTDLNSSDGVLQDIIACVTCCELVFDCHRGSWPALAVLSAPEGCSHVLWATCVVPDYEDRP